MTLAELQVRLKDSRRYTGEIDGLWGPLTEAAILLMLTDGPDTRLTDADLRNAASALNVSFAQVKAVCEVEAAGAGFFAGRPKILPEPHRFSRATGGRFDASHPTLSYPRWGTRPYPRTQDARYDTLLGMVRLDVLAGFASCSYGKFQILGENAVSCGYVNSMQFAEAMARDEQTQLQAFIRFLVSNGIDHALRKCGEDPDSCRDFARRYNGTAYERNAYHEKIAHRIFSIQNEAAPE